MLTKRHFLLALATCALLVFASSRSQRITPALAELPAHTTGSFTEGSGWYPGEPFAYAAPTVRAWGSWSGDDAHTGSVTLGPFPAPRILRFGVGGYPNDPRNSLVVERADTREKIPLAFPAVGERWHVCDFILPADWAGKPLRLIATDEATGLGGWLAITEPVRGGRGDANNALLETLAAWSLNALLHGLLFIAAARRLAVCTTLPSHWIPFAAGAAVATAACVLFGCYLVHPWLGWAFTVALLVASVALLRVSPRLRDRSATGEIPLVTALVLVIGAFYLTALHLFPTSHDFYTLAANRFRESLPSENVLAHLSAEQLFAGSSAPQVSERSPLQIGWQLLSWPAAKLLQLDRKSVSGTAAVWLELLWVTTAYGLLRHFSLTPRRAAAWTATIACTGFFLQNTTFAWPKLSAAAFTVAAFALLFLRPRPAQGSDLKSQIPLAGLATALALLSDPTAAFSFLPILPVVAWSALRPARFRSSLPALAWLAAPLLPWLAYQHFHDAAPVPHLKNHLAGNAASGDRGVFAAIRHAYAPLDLPAIARQKLVNLQSHFSGHASHLLHVSADTQVDRRNEEFLRVGRALTWWPFLALIAFTLRPTASRSPLLTPDLAKLALWLLATVALTSVLSFDVDHAALHHGSYAVMLGLFVWFSVIIERSGRRWLLLLVVLQLVTLSTTWLVPNVAIYGPPAGLPLVLLFASLLLAFALRPFFSRAATDPHSPPASRATALTTAPTGNLNATLPRRVFLLVLGAIALLLFARKPHALHTPQLWAEDGAVFLVQNDTHGLAAFTLPYAGYLHTLPRLIVAAASRVADPAWWPHIYNYAAFAIWLAVIARLFSARFNHLPGKPWLALALIAVPHSGEVFFNITNLQWLTAFVLIQQLLIGPARTLAQLISDILILLVVALTGPFALAFLPLFFARWLLEARCPQRFAFSPRRLLSAAARGHLLAFVTVLLCAAIQAWFVRSGPRFDYQSAPFQLWPTLEILTRRLLAWPIVGRELAFAIPPAALAFSGAIIVLALVVWVLRRHPLREPRAIVLAAFALITLAAIYRTRPDTWAGDNYDYGDRYFYIPRVLLAWLLIWEFHAVPRAVAILARLACLFPLLVHLPAFTVRAPIDYQWAKHVDPIRRGIRADIPTLPEGWTLEYLGRPSGTPPKSP